MLLCKPLSERFKHVFISVQNFFPNHNSCEIHQKSKNSWDNLFPLTDPNNMNGWNIFPEIHDIPLLVCGGLKCTIWQVVQQPWHDVCPTLYFQWPVICYIYSRAWAMWWFRSHRKQGERGTWQLIKKEWKKKKRKAAALMVSMRRRGRWCNFKAA